MLKITKEELPKTLFEVPDFFKLDKVKIFINDNALLSCEESILNIGIQLLDLENENSELRKWFKDECFILDKNHIIIFIQMYMEDINNFNLNKDIYKFQRVISSIEPEYKLKLRKYKINKILTNGK